MQKDTWPPKPSLPDQAMSSVKDVSPGQEASSSWVFLFIPGAVVGAILYLLTGYLVIQSALRSINVGHLGILALDHRTHFALGHLTYLTCNLTGTG